MIARVDDDIDLHIESEHYRLALRPFMRCSAESETYSVIETPSAFAAALILGIDSSRRKTLIFFIAGLEGLAIVLMEITIPTEVRKRQGLNVAAM